MSDVTKRIALVPGSFDPITNGHVSIVDIAASEYDTVYVAVMVNASKEYMFSLEERTEIAKACFKGRDNICVISSDGWLWQLANELGACAIVKGYRNDRDLEYEREMATFNDSHCTSAKTVLIKAREDMTDLCSTSVRELIKNGDSLEHLVPYAAIEKIKEIVK